MFEACQRAQTSHALYRTKHAEWNGPVPDKKELGIPTEVTDIPPDARQWFRAKSDLVFQPPSTVLVETLAVVRSTMRSENERISSAAPWNRRSWSGRSAGCRTGETCKISSTVQSNGSSGEGTDGGVMEKSSGVLRKLVLNSGGFFEFLFSDRWKEGGLLRVLPGQLLNNLLHGLVQLEKCHNVVSYVTMVHTLKPSLKPCMKKMCEEEQKYSIDSTELGKVLVECEYFYPQDGVTVMKLEPDLTSLPSDEEEPSGDVSQRTFSGTPTDQDTLFRTSTLWGTDSQRYFILDLSRKTTVTDISKESQCSKKSVSVSQNLLTETKIAQEPEPTGLLTIPEDDLPSTSQTEFQPAGVSTISEDDSHSTFCTELQSTDPLAEGVLSSEKSSLCAEVITLPSAFSSSIKLSEKTSTESQTSDRLSCERAFRCSTPFLLSRTFMLPFKTEKTLSEVNTSTEIHPRSSTPSRPVVEDGGDDNSLGLEQQDYQEAVSRSWGDADSTGFSRVRCNIRGKAQPPTHTNCLSPYHMIREPFELRRRDQSRFPTVEVPPVRAQTETFYKWSDLWEDDAHLGSKEDDNCEVVCTELALQRYPTAPLTKKSDATFAKQREKLVVEERKRRGKPKTQKGPKGKRACSDDEFEETARDEEKTIWQVDTERMKEFRQDIDLMSAEFFVDKPVAQMNRKKGELKKIDRDRQEPERLPFLVDIPVDTSNGGLEADSKPKKSEGAKQKKMKGKGKKTQLPVTKQNRADAGSSPRTKRKISLRRSSTYKPLKMWSKGPDFLEFYYYLKSEEETEIQSHMEAQTQSRQLTEKGDFPVSISEHDSDEEDRFPDDQEGPSSGKEKLDHALETDPGKETKQKQRVSFGKTADKYRPAEWKSYEKAAGKTFDLRKTKSDVPLVRKANKPGVTQVSQKEKQYPGKVSKQGLPTRVSHSLDILQTGKNLSSQGCLKSTVKSHSLDIPHTGKNLFSQDCLKSTVKSHSTDILQTGKNLSSQDCLKSTVKSHSVDTLPTGKNLSSQDCLRSTVKSLNENLHTVHTYPKAQRKKKELTEDGDALNQVYVSQEQVNQIREADMVISDIDPWRIYVPATSLRQDTHDTADLGNELLKRRETMHRLIDRGKMILQLHKSRVGSIVRQVPVEHRYTAISRKVRKELHASLKTPYSFKADTKYKLKNMSTGKSPQKMQLRETKGKEALAELEEVPQLMQTLPLIGDDNTPTEIKKKETPKTMQDTKVFQISKLKSTYSFENMFAHEKDTIPKYWQRLAKYDNPEIEKMKVKQKRESRKKEKNAKQSLPPKAVVISSPSKAVDNQDEKEEESSPDVDANDFQSNDVITSQFFHHLLLALKLFVVRKERATSQNPFQSRVSVTFSRRPAATAWQVGD